MTERSKKHLFDILFSIDVIFEFIGDLNFIEYEKDLKTKSAVERQLGIIGEALNNFSKDTDKVSITSAREIINLRNRLVHAYDSIDDSIIWAIKTNHLPVLKKEINRLLE